jgi:hypothetical protein
MADSNTRPEELSLPSKELTPKQLAFLHHILDQQGPAFGNATKAAELAGYAGSPGGNQLAVQGHRTLKNPKVQHCLEDYLEAAGCTLQLDAQRLREAMDATKRKIFFSPKTGIVLAPPEPDHPTRLRAIDQKHRLMRVCYPPTASIAPTSPGAMPILSSDESSPECVDAIKKVTALSPADRVLLREVATSDEKLGDAEVDQDPGGRHE